MNSDFKKNITWQNTLITRTVREKKNGHKGIAIWFTGLSGSGKSSIANILESILFKNNIITYLLDGDNIRFGLSSNLGFSIIDRNENIRRIGEVSKLMIDLGIITLVSVIAPYRQQRLMILNMLGKKDFLEIFVNTPIHVCKERDPKKLYKKSHIGEISDFTGVDALYEPPENPDLCLDGTKSLKENTKKIIKILYKNKIIPFIHIS